MANLMPKVGMVRWCGYILFNTDMSTAGQLTTTAHYFILLFESNISLSTSKNSLVPCNRYGCPYTYETGKLPKRTICVRVIPHMYAWVKMLIRDGTNRFYSSYSQQEDGY